MSLEAFGFIKDLVPSNPTGADPKSQGDDHLRGIKSTLQQQFAGFTQGQPITLTESQLNALITDYVRRDGSLPMTGNLVVDGFVKSRRAGFPNRGLLMSCSQTTLESSLTAVDDAGVTIDVLNVALNALGVPQAVEMGRGGVPFRQANALPNNTNDTRVAHTAFVVALCQRAIAFNPANVGLGPEVLIVQTGSVVLGSQPALASANLQAVVGGTTATVRITLKIIRASDSAVLSEASALQTGGPGWESNLQCRATITAPGETVYARLFVSADQAATTAAGYACCVMEV